MNGNENNQNNNNYIETKKIKLTAHDRKFEILVTMDFNNVSKTQLRQWAFADRIIAMQRALRDCSSETLETFSDDGYQVHALAAGQKPKTFAEVRDEMKTHMATLGADEKQRMIEELMNSLN